MTKDEIKPFIEKYATKYGLKPEIVFGVCMQESWITPAACRYEPHYRWIVNPSRVKPKTCSQTTEETLQKTSFGVMQVMGAVFREYGFMGWLTEIFVSVDIQLDYGCRHLANKIKQYGEDKGILAYNSGSPITKGGEYVNQEYLDGVRKFSQTY